MSDASVYRVGSTKRMLRPFVLLAATWLMFLVASELIACQVPVFRYALERWNADRYRVVVLHEEPLGETQDTALKQLRKFADRQPGRRAAIDLHVVNAASTKDARLSKIWQHHGDPSQPLMLVYYPKANDVGREAPAYQAPLDGKHVASLLDSPLRRKIAQRLGQGDSAVWIFVPCGREAEDKAAYARLEKQLAADSNWLKLPSAAELEVQESVLEATKIPLRIGFSIQTLKRDDKAEQFLLQALLHSEDDLTSFDQPLAFPVFGQGRVLYCLVGKGIAEDTIRSASAFMAGPCSCQVKNQNPGFDLLLQANWKDILGDVLISEPIQTPDQDALEPTLLTIPPGRKNK